MAKASNTLGLSYSPSQWAENILQLTSNNA